TRDCAGAGSDDSGPRVGPLHRGTALWRARGRILDRIWTAALRLEAWRNRLPDQRVAARRIRAHGGTGDLGDRLRRQSADGSSSRSDEQTALAAGVDFVRGTSGESDYADSAAWRVLCA